MTVKNLASLLGCAVVCGDGDMLGREIGAGYCGDLLSWVMGRAKAGSAWITVMGNVNTVAVAVLADVGCIVLAEGAALDTEAVEKAKEHRVAVLSSLSPAFELAGKLYEALK